jgi:hypothetical protein
MHGPYQGPAAVPASSLGFTSAATKTGMTGTFIGNHRNFVVSTSSKTFVPYMVINSASGWSSWAVLSTIPNLGGLKPGHGIVGLTSILDGAGEARTQMAVWSANENGSNMYVSPILIPGTAPPWPTFTWSNVGSPPSGNKWKGVPAIVAVGPVTTSRVDYFAYASNTNDDNGAIYYRWKFNGVWQNGSWTQIPQPPGGVTLKSGPSAALKGNTLYLAARGSDDAMWINTLPNVTDSATYGGPWTGWTSMGGVWLSPPALTAWERGVDLYGLGSDSTLYHMTMDADGIWSDYIQISPTTYSTALVTAQNLLPSTHEIDILTVSGQTPNLTRFPW